MVIFLSLLILSALILIHEFGHFLAAKRTGVMVEEFGIGLPPRILGKQIGETIYSLNLLPFGGFVRLLGENAAPKEAGSRAFSGQTPLKRFFILFAGVLMNFILGFLLIWLLFVRGNEVVLNGDTLPTSGDKKVAILFVSKGSPAELAGMRVGDKILRLAAAGQDYTISKLQQVVELSQEFAGQEVAFTLLRDKQELEMRVTPRKNPPQGEGALGIALDEVGLVKYGLVQGLLEAGKASVSTSLYIFVATGQALRQLVLQQDFSNVAGPVGIVNFASSAINGGLSSALNFIAMISLNLAVFNILPLPALDGGRIIFVIWEGITRRPVPQKVESWVHALGMVLLLGLLLIITIVDISKFI